MASSNTPVSLGTRKALRILEVLLKVFVAALLGQILLALLDTPGEVTLAIAWKAVVAAIIAVIQAIISMLGFVAPESNPNTTSLLPARFDPSTPPNNPLPVNPGVGTDAPAPGGPVV